MGYFLAALFVGIVGLFIWQKNAFCESEGRTMPIGDLIKYDCPSVMAERLNQLSEKVQ